MPHLGLGLQGLREDNKKKRYTNIFFYLNMYVIKKSKHINLI